MAITTKEHSKVVLGSRHALHNFEYANAAARTGATGLTVDNNFQVARQIDTETYWILTDYSGPTWLEITTGLVSNATFNDIYDNESGLHDILIDDGDVQWRMGAANSFIIEMIAGVGNVDGFFLENGTDFCRFTRKAANTITLEAALFNVDIDSSGTMALDSASTIEWSGTNASLTNAGALAIADNFTLTGGGTITAGVGALSLTAGSASDFTVTGDNLTLATATSGDIIVTSVDLMDINAGNDLDVDVTGNTAIDSTGTIEWSGTNASLSSAGIMSLLGTGSQIVLESHTDTSGNVVSIKSTPGSSSTAKLMVLEAQGGNWGSGARVLEIISDDNDARPLVINNGSGDVITMLRTGGITMSSDITFTAGGSLLSTANGDVSIVPNGTGVFMCGTGSPGHLTPTSGEAYFQGQTEFGAKAYFDAGISVQGAQLTLAADRVLQESSTYGGIVPRQTDQTPDCMMFLTGSANGHIIICEYLDRTYDFAHAIDTKPTVYIQSENQSATEFATLAWNEQTIGGGKGSYCGLKSTTEEITIPVGQGGLGKKVDSSANLVPATSRIIQVVSRVTQAPGGGATTLDIGRTSGGNIDEYADATAVALGSTTIASDDGDGNTAIPHWQTSADTMQVGTDFDVTGTDMKIRVVVFYEEITVPTA